MPGTDVKIKWESLPKQYQTKENKNFYDKDNDGWINQKNKNGQNEIELMEKGLNLKSGSLMRYATTCITEHDSDYRNSTRTNTANAQGPKGRVVSYEYAQRNNNGENKTYIDSVFNANGRLIYSSENHFNYIDSRHHESWGTNYLYEEFPLTEGKYNLVRKTTTKHQNFDGSLRYDVQSVAAGEIPDQFRLVKNYGTTTSDKYYLNGEEVKAKAIGGGRYEVTKSDGTVVYISHDGYMLNPDYVAKTPKKIRKQKPAMGIN